MKMNSTQLIFKSNELTSYENIITQIDALHEDLNMALIDGDNDRFNDINSDIEKLEDMMYFMNLADQQAENLS